jgi:hypothetical protein
LVHPAWVGAGPPFIHGQVCHLRTDGQGFNVDMFGPPAPPWTKVQAMDGVFLAMRRAVAESVPFDEAAFDGFHLYDTDFTFSAYLAGFRLGVCHDIHLLHQSAGQFGGGDWTRAAQLFLRKRGDRMPRFAPRPFHWSSVAVPTREEVLEAMEYYVSAPASTAAPGPA